jgi:acetate kinase
MNILVLNAGSSSHKSCLFQLSPEGLPERPPAPLWQAQLDWTQQEGLVKLTVSSQGQTHHTELIPSSRLEGVTQMLETLWSGPNAVIHNPQQLDGVGHRVVHGGQTYRTSTLVTPDVKATIADLAKLAPAHNPANLEGIEVLETILGADIPQIAIFDTAFHAHIPLAAAVYPGPYRWFEQGIQRYGFHGISHQYCAQQAAQLLQQDPQTLRLIICHLGNGCSLSAVCNGTSVDTTMGFTPLDGLMMGSRSGAVDPGILIHLMRQDGCNAGDLNRMLNQESGLKGISGISGDMRQIEAAIAQGHQRAQLALDIYIHRLQACIGAMLPSLGGLDALVFTAGVGENSASIRATTCEAFQFLGLKLDAQKNQSHPSDQDIATPDSTVRVLVIHTQEDWAIAQACWHHLTTSASPRPQQN